MGIEGFTLDQFLLPITDQEEEAMKLHTRQVKPGRRGGQEHRNGQENNQREDENEVQGRNNAEIESKLFRNSNYFKFYLAYYYYRHKQTTAIFSTKIGQIW